MGRMYTKKTICYLSEIQKYNGPTFLFAGDRV